jgi:hypothetical protein
MSQRTESNIFPATLQEFLTWDPVDGHKYEWSDGEIIKFDRMNKQHL